MIFTMSFDLFVPLQFTPSHCRARNAFGDLGVESDFATCSLPC